MASVSLSVRRFVLIAPIIDAYRCWRWSRTRLHCEKCVACSSTLESDARQLLREGHYRSAVFIARLQLEKLVKELGGDGSNCKCTISQAMWLKTQLTITERERNKICYLYSRASRIVHGQALSKGRASNIVREINALMRVLAATRLAFANGGNES